MEKEIVKEVVENIIELGDTIVSSAVPEDAKKHFRSAIREALLGMISILDHADEKQKSSTTNHSQDNPTNHTINITD